jgi:hypothetical protein
VVRHSPDRPAGPPYRNVGSPLPRRIGPSVAARSTGRPGRHRRSQALSVPGGGVVGAVTGEVSQVRSVELAVTHGKRTRFPLTL